MHREHMRHMNEMFVNPFGMMGYGPQLALTDTAEPQRDYDRRTERRRGHHHAPYDHSNAMARHGHGQTGNDLFSNMFGQMNHMMSNMHGMMGNMHAGMDSNSQVFSQSRVMSYSNTGGGQPRVYEATSTSRQAPGGVKETKKTVRDSETGLEKIAIGHHIGEKSHVVTRKRNVRTGDLEENEDMVNLDENEVPSFNEEFQNRTQHYSNRSIQGQRSDRRRQRAITDGSPGYQRSHSDRRHTEQGPKQ